MDAGPHGPIWPEKQEQLQFPHLADAGLTVEVTFR